MQKIKFFNVKWTLKDNNLQQSHYLKILKLKTYILGKFQCTSRIKFSFDDIFFSLKFF